MSLRVKKKGRDDFGFTLVELMITLAMTGIIVVAIYSAYNVQQRTYYTQDQVIEVQQNLRAALDVMVREIRMAGYDPSRSNGFSITTTTANKLIFDMDLDEDGITGGTNESITYELSGTTLDRNGQAIAENIEAIEVQFLDAVGNPLAYSDIDEVAEQSARDDIRSVQISLLARADQRDPKYVNNTVYTPASGTAWDLNGAAAGNAPNDNFRRRMLMVTVQCRSMGL